MNVSEQSRIVRDRDLLSELLAPLRLHGVFHSRWSLAAPWGIAGDSEDCALLHYIREGECAVELAGRSEPLLLRRGDLAVFPHGTAHRLGDRPGRDTVPLVDLLPRRPPGAVRTVRTGGPGPRTELICGGLHYAAAAAAPLYRALPAVLVLDRAAVESEPMLADTLGRISADDVHTGPGGPLVALRAFEMVFVLAMRAALSGLAHSEPLLRAVGHPAVAAALLAVQTRFAEPWTLESLAAEAGLSRSAFAAVFRELVGEPPMAHLTARRMQEAARLLTETDMSQARIAERVGYRSTAGFHLAFRAWSGGTPGEHRRTAAPAAPSAVSE
ncbi:AraC-like DNA-binding protein [Murinocardiopsis flavida]|uniref:AraC-like DNA-binding protein n=1 Tax=Murinocardiopsis flavida TaxID=645275 RepID=A0A2P8DP51_9ACTN|nr:AraC family transcriptional regulator [Murinocardiopsis flavida]PSK98998.1 AraC-like DNA-binding protein [Murinocardiopsis flavida]